ncbi:MAG TPA: hypothetical protein VFA36_02380 [Burkholderiales bacterium]|nr:hypothetical protein [Burkholderiales bacterium]
MDWTAELYVHAMAVEDEAARRYALLARRTLAESHTEAAAVFAELAAQDGQHLEALRRRTAGMTLPALTSDYTWRADDAAGALDAEKHARAFFEHAGRIAREREARSLAQEMAEDENRHIALLERVIAS